jgi:hypothetical protein
MDVFTRADEKDDGLRLSPWLSVPSLFLQINVHTHANGHGAYNAGLVSRGI